MIFRIVLWIIGVRFSQLARFNSSFRYKIMSSDAVIQFQTFDGSICRHFEFRDGQVKSREGAHPLSEQAATLGPRGLHMLIFAFDQPANGVRILIKSKTDQSVLLKGVQAGRVRITGDMALLVWFGEISGYL